MKRTQIYLDEKQTKKLELLAAMAGDSSSALIRRAIDDFIAQQESKAKQRKKKVADILTSFSNSWKDDDNRRWADIRRSFEKRLHEWGV